MNSKKVRPAVPALNFHVWQPCNMRCQYCFAGFQSAVPRLREDKALLSERALAVLREAAHAGIDKVTFVGGEPLLCPWLTDLLMMATRLGMVTMVVSNGSRMDGAWMARNAPWLKWAAVSIDSLCPQANERIGRVARGAPAPGAEQYAEVLHGLSAHGIRTKVNTVVSSLNWTEDFRDFFAKVKPERWKILQALHIQGENDSAFPEFAVSDEQFLAFVSRHQTLSAELMLAAEDNDSMTESYLMVDPLGRFFSNAGGFYRYSAPIWEVGWNAALSEVSVSADKFSARGGHYVWK
jgi:radical S-adenosyl methionine domain-containing protein 2